MPGDTGTKLQILSLSSLSLLTALLVPISMCVFIILGSRQHLVLAWLGVCSFVFSLQVPSFDKCRHYLCSWWVNDAYIMWSFLRHLRFFCVKSTQNPFGIHIQNCYLGSPHCVPYATVFHMPPCATCHCMPCATTVCHMPRYATCQSFLSSA